MKKSQYILTIMLALVFAYSQGAAQKPAASNIALVNEQPNPLPVGVRLILPAGISAKLTTTNNIGALDPAQYPMYFVFRQGSWIKVDMQRPKKPASNLQPL